MWNSAMKSSSYPITPKDPSEEMSTSNGVSEPVEMFPKWAKVGSE